VSLCLCAFVLCAFVPLCLCAFVLCALCLCALCFVPCAFVPLCLCALCLLVLLPVYRQVYDLVPHLIKAIFPVNLLPPA